MAQRHGRRVVRHPSPARRVGGLGLRAQRRAQHAAGTARLVGLPVVRAARGPRAICPGGGPLRLELDGQAHAGDLAAGLSAPGLLAPARLWPPATDDAGRTTTGSQTRRQGDTQTRRQGDTGTRLFPVPNPRSPIPLALLVLEKVPLSALSAASSVATYFVQRSGGSVVAAEHLGLLTRVENAVLAYAAYIGKTFWPWTWACCIHTRPLPIMPAQCWPPPCSVAVSAVVIWLAWRGRRYGAVGWFWFLGTLVPAIGIIQVGEQSMADRYTYVPLVGLFLVLTWGGAESAVGRPASRMAGRRRGAARAGRLLSLDPATSGLLAHQRDPAATHARRNHRQRHHREQPGQRPFVRRPL